MGLSVETYTTPFFFSLLNMHLVFTYSYFECQFATNKVTSLLKDKIS